MPCPEGAEPGPGASDPCAVLGEAPAKPRGCHVPSSWAPHHADVPNGQLLAWELVELGGRVRAAGHPAPALGEEGVFLEHLGRHLSGARRGPASGWSGGSPPATHSRLLAPQFGRAGSFPAMLAAVLSRGVFAPSKPTSLTGPHSSFLSSRIKRGDRGHAACQWQSWCSPTLALPGH